MSTRKPASRSHSAHISSYPARDSMRPGVSWNRNVASGWKWAKYDVASLAREGADQGLGELQWRDDPPGRLNQRCATACRPLPATPSKSRVMRLPLLQLIDSLGLGLAVADDLAVPGGAGVLHDLRGPPPPAGTQRGPSGPKT